MMAKQTNVAHQSLKKGEELDNGREKAAIRTSCLTLLHMCIDKMVQ